MNELEKILVLVQELENDLVADDLIDDSGFYSSQFERIKTLLYKESIK
jgi:hypothetical protein